MRYNCHEIEEILNCTNLSKIDEAALLEHLETCNHCRNLGEIDSVLEEALGVSLSYAAPEAISDAVMSAVRIESAREKSRSIFRGVYLAFIPMILLLSAAIAYLNRDYIYQSLLSGDEALEKFRRWLGAIDIHWNSMLSVLSKAAGSTLVLMTLAAALLIIWIYSTINFKEISE